MISSSSVLYSQPSILTTRWSFLTDSYWLVLDAFDLAADYFFHSFASDWCCSWKVKVFDGFKIITVFWLNKFECDNYLSFPVDSHTVKVVMVLEFHCSNIHQMLCFSWSDCACKFSVVLILNFNFDLVSPGTVTVILYRAVILLWRFDFTFVEVRFIPFIILA